MRQKKRSAVLLVLAFGLAAPGRAGQTAPRPDAQAATAGRTDAGAPFESARACASCHRLIHSYWSESSHARSASRPSYLQAVEAAVASAADKDAVRRQCVWCHAPTALVTGDYGLRERVTREGVSCDFCHTVTAVDLGRAGNPFDMEPGRVKRGPLQYASSASHDTAYSSLHRTSPLLCAACHEFKNALGVPVLTAYTEWRESPYAARGMPCQECHMPLVPGTTVPEGLKPTGHVINLHRIVGGTSGKVGAGLDLRIESVTRRSVAAEVDVVLTSTAVGHSAPGGFPNRALVLAVGVESASGELLHRRERVYRRELRDGDGRELASYADLLLKAASVASDTRIRPGESRAEHFTVPLPEGARAIVARLEYRDTSDPKAPRTILVSEERQDFR